VGQEQGRQGGKSWVKKPHFVLSGFNHRRLDLWQFGHLWHADEGQSNQLLSEALRLSAFIGVQIIIGS